MGYGILLLYLKAKEPIMAIIRKGLPNNTRGNYTKYDNKVFMIKGMSDGAKVVYGFLASLKSGEEFNDVFVCNGLGIKQRTLTRRKQELRDAGLIYMVQTGLKSYVMYIGYVGFNAIDVKRHWEYVAKQGNQGVSMEELIKDKERALAEDVDGDKGESNE